MPNALTNANSEGANTGVMAAKSLVDLTKSPSSQRRIRVERTRNSIPRMKSTAVARTLKAVFEPSLMGVATVLLVAILVPRDSLGQQDPRADQVLEQWASKGLLPESAGLRLIRNPILRTLPNEGEHWERVYLEAGMRYIMSAVCDYDCLDIDLALYDTRGNLLDSDHATDKEPILFLKPLWDGEYLLLVSMPDCRAPQCTFGLGLWAR